MLTDPKSDYNLSFFWVPPKFLRPGMERFYLHLEECQPCIEGSICPGSSEIEILPGFFSSKDRVKHTESVR